MNRDRARAFAPASVGNVAVGFDLLGHALDGIGDTVTVRRIERGVVRIAAIHGSDRELPRTPERNTAGRAVQALAASLDPPFGFELEIHKGIPFGSGLGGSAASATAAVVAANELLSKPLSRDALYPFALEGEYVASGSMHGDNVAPQLLGGLVLLGPGNRLVRIPVPDVLHCAVVRPDFALETRAARAVLVEPYPLATVIAQQARLANVLAGCFLGDLELIAAALSDVLVEPRRAGLIPGFAEVKRAALGAAALGCSISGAGPSVFAWYGSRAAAEAGAQAMRLAFEGAGFRPQTLVSAVSAPGARVLED